MRNYESEMTFSLEQLGVQILLFPENFMFFFCIKNRLPIRRELSYTIHLLRDDFVYQLGL